MFNEIELEKNVEFAINESIEFAYRRGYAHGFSFGSQTREEDLKSQYDKVIKWRYDLTNKKGAPGSPFEDVEMYKNEKYQSGESHKGCLNDK